MNRRKKDGRSAIDVIEETGNVLRAAPAAALLAYYLGGIPFIIFLMNHAARLGSGAGTQRMAVTGALWLAALFLWMKCWQVVFASRVMAAIRRVEPSPWTPARAWRMFIQQTAVQPLGLLMIPLAAVFAIPFARVHAFFQSATVLGDGEESSVTALVSKSWKQSGNWPRQNLIGIWLLSPWMLGIGLFVLMTWLLSSAVPSALLFVIIMLALSSALFSIGLSSPLGLLIAGNVAAAILFLPWAAQHWFGWRTTFSLAGFHAVFNSTFLLIVFSITYLVLDPLMKTFYVLRCFYGESRRSGEDLRVDLRSLASRAASAIVLVVVLVLAPSSALAKKKSDSAPSSASAGKTDGMGGSSKKISNDWKPAQPEFPTIGIQPDELNRKIDDVLKRPVYQWRLPPQPEPEVKKGKGFLDSFFEEVTATMKRFGQWLSDRLGDFERWLRHRFGKSRGEESGSFSVSGPSPSVWVYILVFSLIALVIVAGILIFKKWRAKRLAALSAQAIAAASIPDIHDENILANQLPADEWLALAREFAGKGEYRGALRALFLASLALLAGQQLVAIARGKTNYDYLRELRRRAHALPAVPQIFGENILTFERVWYGRDTADENLVSESEQRLSSLRESVAGVADPGHKTETPHA